MSKSAPLPLSLARLNDIDRMSFSKAGAILDEARSCLARFDHDLAVRRSQEAFELYLKSLFRFLQMEPPATHDLKKQIYQLSEAVVAYNINTHQVAQLVLANSMLDLWRSPAFYGDETLNVGNLFGTDEAKLAITYAERGQFVCSVVRGQVYSRAVTYEKT